MYPHLRGLPLKDLVNTKPKILIVLDQANFLWLKGQRHGKDKEPCAVKTLLGWIAYGNANSTSTEANVFCTHQVSRPTMKFLFHDAIKQDESLHDLVKLHFTTEEFGVTPPSDLISQEVRRAMDIMERSLKMMNHQYEIALLWNADDVKLLDNYPMAYKRLVGLEKTLKKKPHLLEWKNNYMRGLVEKGYARIASEDELAKNWPRI